MPMRQIREWDYTRSARDHLSRFAARLRPITTRMRISLALVLVVVLVLVLASFVYTQRHQLASADWTMYHDDPARTGYIASVPDPSHLTIRWKHPLDGAVYAEPLVIAGEVVVATEHDSLYALDAQTGVMRWHLSVGTPVPLGDLPCGDIDPLGITGTPVYAPQTGLVYAVAEIQGPAHLLVGVDLKSGEVKVRRLVDPPGASPQTQQQRAALALDGDQIYIGFGGLDGDCGVYHGWIVASRADGTGTLLTYQVPTAREGGIWAPSGPVIDAEGHLYVSVGNGASTQGSWDHSDSIVRLSPSLHLEDAFAPQRWQQDNANDLDLGSLGPVLLPNGLLVAAGKSGEGYLLHVGHLGGIGGQLQTLALCNAGAYGGGAVSGQVAFIPCADGVRALRLTASARLVLQWQAPRQVTGSPIIGGNTVYSLDPGGGRLYALDATTGAVRATLVVGPTSRFATAALSRNVLYVGTLTGVVAVGLQ